MYWIVPTWISTLLIAFLLGRYIANLSKEVAEIKQTITMKADKQPEPEEPESELIDPDDPVQEAIYQHKVEMERLNGKQNSSNN